jgi:hypothetical protein
MCVGQSVIVGAEIFWFLWILMIVLGLIGLYFVCLFQKWRKCDPYRGVA